jgi:hypothetical protein
VRAYILTVIDSVGGTTNPSPGNYQFRDGEYATIEATPNAPEYFFDRWIINGQPLQGPGSTWNPIQLYMINDFTIEASFDNHYNFTIQPSQWGTTDPPPGTYEYEYGQSISVTAIPSDDEEFDCWYLDDQYYYPNPIPVTMNSDHILAAYFMKYCNLSIGADSIPSGGGTTNPAPGFYRHQYGSSLQVQAIPNPGWVFTHWVFDGENRFGPNPFSIDSIQTNHTLVAYFLPDGGGGWESCPLLFAWNGTNYVSYGVVDIHDPSGEDMVRNISLLKQDVGIDSEYLARFTLVEGFAGLNFSESVIDQMRLYALDSFGHVLPCPLISANHGRLGNVLFNLTLSDNRKVRLFLMETLDLTFIMPYPQQYIQGYTLKIEGCNQLKQ